MWLLPGARVARRPLAYLSLKGFIPAPWQGQRQAGAADRPIRGPGVVRVDADGQARSRSRAGQELCKALARLFEKPAAPEPCKITGNKSARGRRPGTMSCPGKEWRGAARSRDNSAHPPPRRRNENARRRAAPVLARAPSRVPLRMSGQQSLAAPAWQAGVQAAGDFDAFGADRCEGADCPLALPHGYFWNKEGLRALGPVDVSPASTPPCACRRRPRLPRAPRRFPRPRPAPRWSCRWWRHRRAAPDGPPASWRRPPRRGRS